LKKAKNNHFIKPLPKAENNKKNKSGSKNRTAFYFPLNLPLRFYFGTEIKSPYLSFIFSK